MATLLDTAQSPAPSALRRRIAGNPLAAYFLLAFVLMWLFAVPLALSRSHGSAVLPIDFTDTVGNVLYLLATFSGPTVAALIVTGATEGLAGVLRLLKRCIQWRVAPQWYLVALLANLAIWLLA